ncbi:MAG TPA: transporter substrate-binding domain-containing protein [bacterium]|nr:transporter substrate-binding domain-containing protein [bacterium]
MKKNFLFILIFSFVICRAAVYTDTKYDFIDKTIRTQHYKVAVLSNFPALYYLDKNNKPIGLAIDVLNEVSKKLGFRYSYQIVNNWSEAKKLLSEGEVDFIPGITQTDETLGEFIASINSIEVASIICLVRNNEIEINNIMELKGKNTGVLKGGATHIKMKDWQNFNLVIFDDIDEGLLALLSGKIDGFVLPKTGVIKRIQDLKLEDKFKIVGKPFMEIKRVYLFRKNNQDLKNQIDKALDEILRSQFYRDVYIKWYGRPEPFWTLGKVLILLSALFIFLIIVIFLWSYYSINKLNIKLKLQNELLKENEIIIQKQLNELKEKNENLNQFNYTVSHDLKTPLITIKGYVELILRDLEKNKYDNLLKNAKKINNAADKMQNLIDDLLQYSQLETNQLKNEIINVNNLIVEVYNILGIAIKDKKIKIMIDKDLKNVYADKNRMLQIFKNLIENAIKYSNNEIQPIINIGWTSEENGYRTYYVKDNGIGIEEKYKDKIFKLFERLNPKIEGTGVGLAITKKIIESYKGKIWFEVNTETSGTIFYFTLPMI